MQPVLPAPHFQLPPTVDPRSQQTAYVHPYHHQHPHHYLPYGSHPTTAAYYPPLHRLYPHVSSGTPRPTTSHPYPHQHPYPPSATSATVVSSTQVSIPAQKPDKIKKKRRKTKKNKIIIPLNDMIRLLTLPQPIAAQKLKVSVSTLKRRYYELDLGRWPANCFQDEVSFESSANHVAMQSSFHQDIFNTAEDHQPATVYALSQYKEPSMTQKSEMGTLLNLFDIQDSKHVDQMTNTVLLCAFAQHMSKDDDDSLSDE